MEEQAAGWNGAHAHFMRVDCDGGYCRHRKIPGKFSFQEGQDKAAEGSVHMQVNALLRRHFRQLLNGIHLAILRRSCYAHQCHRPIIQ